ncbi:hypothetical protein PCH_Pc13g01230 [Penicillium rubens Wisconsin 54-1255]|uniref:Uncharacterized protein n=1 Tax=Penicillium rubens (strain ATCC 28089 / DSM 1075 / NRRL 1951 / Wisconsin 54-1255) TaxID=500485 RepID=B6H1N1_PENRW|nr:hypothetical protein PCH_Pc13g01230 [Penicillium rubens Wisconsin 54-1255]
MRVSKSFNSAFSSSVFGLGSGYSCFRRFLDHPGAFRRVLRCGAVVTGPLVFQYFAKQYVDDVEIDILVSYDQSHTVTQHLQQSEGYEMVDEECSPFTETLKVSRFKKERKTVRVSAIRNLTPLAFFLTHERTTACFNFLTEDYGYCLFPMSMRRKLDYRVCPVLEEIEYGWLPEPQDGWTFYADFPHDGVTVSDHYAMVPVDMEIRTDRWIGDRFTWKVKLFTDSPAEGVEKREYAFFVKSQSVHLGSWNETEQ